MPDYENFRRLYQCDLCDTINVVFPDYKSTGQFKIVKTVWNVLKDRYESMELGDLSISLAEALGVSNSYSGSASPSTDVDKVVEEAVLGVWRYRKWANGTSECWCTWSGTVASYTSVFGGYGYYKDINFPTGMFNVAPKPFFTANVGTGFSLSAMVLPISATSGRFFFVGSSSGSQSVTLHLYLIGTWK